MKKLLAVLMAMMLLCSCASRSMVEKPNEEEESMPPVSEEVSPDTSSAPQEEELDIDVGDPSFATEEIPDGYYRVEFDGFSVLVSGDSFAGCAPMETVTMENGQFVGNDGENKRIIAELLAVEAVDDPDAPFAPYDEKYSDSVNTVDLSLGGFAAKKYHIQTQSDGPVPVKINEYFYCIYCNDRMIIFAYYPVMGMGGMHTEEIEAILNTIK